MCWVQRSRLILNAFLSDVRGEKSYIPIVQISELVIASTQKAMMRTQFEITEYERLMTHLAEKLSGSQRIVSEIESIKICTKELSSASAQENALVCYSTEDEEPVVSNKIRIIVDEDFLARLMEEELLQYSEIENGLRNVIDLFLANQDFEDSLERCFSIHYFELFGNSTLIWKFSRFNERFVVMDDFWTFSVLLLRNV